MYETSSHRLIQLLIVIALDGQLDDLVRFCASSAGIETCIMTVDPTFYLGEFECTPITYRHLLVVTRRNKTSRVHWTNSPLQNEFRIIFILCFISGISKARTSVLAIVWI